MDKQDIAKIARKLEAQGVDLHELAKECLKSDEWTLEERLEAAKLIDIASTQLKKKN